MPLGNLNEAIPLGPGVYETHPTFPVKTVGLYVGAWAILMLQSPWSAMTMNPPSEEIATSAGKTTPLTFEMSVLTADDDAFRLRMNLPLVSGTRV
jgi:hypothetical protein